MTDEAEYTLTNDLSIPLRDGATPDDVARDVLQRAMAGASGDELVRGVQERFLLSAEDAELACDRAFGGVVRAATGLQANYPDPSLDPVAAASFRLAQANPRIISDLYPDRAFAPPPSGPVANSPRRLIAILGAQVLLLGAVIAFARGCSG